MGYFSLSTFVYEVIFKSFLCGRSAVTQFSSGFVACDARSLKPKAVSEFTKVD